MPIIPSYSEERAAAAAVEEYVSRNHVLPAGWKWPNEHARATADDTLAPIPFEK